MFTFGVLLRYLVVFNCVMCRLVSLLELNISANDLEEIPPSIGLLRHLRTLYADENFIIEVPPEVSRAVRLYSLVFYLLSKLLP